MRNKILALAIGGILAVPVATTASPASAHTIISTAPLAERVVVRKKPKRVVRHVYYDRYGNRHVVVRERPRRVIVRERPVYVVP